MPNQYISSVSVKQASAVFLTLVAILAAIGIVGLRAPILGMDLSQMSHTTSWLVIMLLLACFTVLAGYGITGRWRGILIDKRNKLNLARLQLLGWTLLVLSAFFSAVLLNVGLEGVSPLNVEIPSQLWVVMGISTGSAVGASALIAQKETGSDRETTTVHSHDSPDKARWGDILKGDDKGSADTVDMGKLQMFLFSFLLILAYAAVIADKFSSGGTINSLPSVDDGMNVLLGISHTGYLSSQAVNRTAGTIPAKS